MNGDTGSGDVSTGELWRGQQALATSVQSIETTLAALPGAIISQLETRLTERLSALREEVRQGDAGVRADLNATQITLAGAAQRQDDKIKDLRTVVYGACSFILISFLGALITLTLVHNGK